MLNDPFFNVVLLNVALFTAPLFKAALCQCSTILCSTIWCCTLFMLHNLMLYYFNIELFDVQKQPSRGVLKKRCSEKLQQIYRRKRMLKCDFNKVAKQLIEITLEHGCSPVNLLHIFTTPFLKNKPGQLLLDVELLNVILFDVTQY